MNNRIKTLLFFYLLLGICYSLFAIDFGLSLNQGIGGSDGGFRYKGNLVPRVSGLIGDDIDYYVSAGAEVAYLDGVAFIPELLRTEFSFRSSALAVKAGRMYQSDPMGLIASGLFDGARVSYDSSVGSFYAGAWYTGLLYKKRINVEMTASDYELTNEPLNTSNFGGTYFAPKRMVTSLGWEHLSLGGDLSVSTALLGQFDLSGGKALNSQYLAGKVSLPVKAFSFDLGLDLGACIEFIQQEGESGIGFLADLGVGFTPPIPPIFISNKLSLLARLATGGNTFAFLPVTTVGQGNILGAKLSGITMIRVDYTAQVNNELSAGISSSYFIRNDKNTYAGYPLPAGKSGDGNLLGNEFFAQLLWNPFSDIQASFGGGIFLPSMGNALSNAGSSWRVELNVILLLY